MADNIAGRIDGTLQKRMSRRELFKEGAKIAAVAAGTLATANVAPGLIETGAKKLAELAEPSLNGRFLDTKDGGKTYKVTQDPIPVSVVYTSIRNEATGKTGIMIRQGNPSDQAKEIPAQPSEFIRLPHAVRVLGGGYVMQNPENKNFGRIPVEYNGKTEQGKGGLWFMISNEKGEPINPFTKEPLNKALHEEPYYVSARYVSVIPPKFSSK